MFVKDYYKNFPQGFEEKDVWVCESKYLAKNKAFKKMKVIRSNGLKPCLDDCLPKCLDDCLEPFAWVYQLDQLDRGDSENGYEKKPIGFI